jgi:hypothetical protein
VQALVPVVLSLLAKFMPMILSGGAAGTAAEVIAILEQAVPLAVQVGEALATPIRNIIAALRASGAVTVEQLDQLDTLEAKLDADFDAAAEAAEAADAAAAAKPAT